MFIARAICGLTHVTVAALCCSCSLLCISNSDWATENEAGRSVSVNGNEEPRWWDLPTIQCSCNCNYSLITHNKTTVHYTWGLLRVCVRPARLPVLTWVPSSVPVRTISKIRSPPGPRRIQHGVMLQYSQRLDLCHSLVIRKRRAYKVLVTHSQEKSPRRIPRHEQYGPWRDTSRRYGPYRSESWYGQWRGILNTAIQFKAPLARWATVSFHTWSRSVAAHLFCTRCAKHGIRSHRFQKPRYWRPSAGKPLNHRRWGRRQSWAWYAHTDDVCRPQIPGTEAVLRGCQTACTRCSNLPCYSRLVTVFWNKTPCQNTRRHIPENTECVISLRHYHLVTYLLSPWSTVLEKLTGSQSVKKFPAF